MGWPSFWRWRRLTGVGTRPRTVSPLLGTLESRQRSEPERATDQRLSGLGKERSVGVVHVELVGGTELLLQDDPPQVVVDGVVAIPRQRLAVDGHDLGALDDVAPAERDLTARGLRL